MSRKTARKNAFQIVFQTSFHENEETKSILEMFYKQNNISNQDEQFITRTFSGVFDNLEKIDKLIDENSIKWGKERLSKVDLAILRVALYEIIYADDIASGVAINEAVELAKEFSTDESPSFINGILGTVNNGLGKNDGE